MSSQFKLDLDGNFDKEAFVKDLKKILWIFSWSKAYVEIYKTERGHHIYVKTIPRKRISSLMICAIQLYLGSDKERELFNIERIRRKEKDWNVLFVVKRKGDKVVSREKLLEKIAVVL